MTKIKPIRRLWHQFNELITEPHFDCYELYEILKGAGFIEGVAFSAPHGAELPTHYREIRRERMEYNEYMRLIQGALIKYCIKNYIEYEAVLIAESAAKPEEHYNPDDFGM